MQRVRIKYLESGIHSVESRIQDWLRIPYMGQNNKQTGNLFQPEMYFTEL